MSVRRESLLEKWKGIMMYKTLVLSYIGGLLWNLYIERILLLNCWVWGDIYGQQTYEKRKVVPYLQVNSRGDKWLQANGKLVLTIL